MELKNVSAILAILALFAFCIFLSAENNDLKVKLSSQKVLIKDLNESFFDTFYGAALCYNSVYCERADCSVQNFMYFSNEDRKDACLSIDFVTEGKFFESKVLELSK